MDKRKIIDSPDRKKKKRICVYGEDCFRRNPYHFKEYSHPHLERIIDNSSGKDEFPIPERLSIQKVQLLDQIKIITDHKIYEIVKDTSGHCSKSYDFETKSRDRIVVTGKSVEISGNSSRPNESQMENNQANSSQKNLEISKNFSRDGETQRHNYSTTNRNQDVSNMIKQNIENSGNFCKYNESQRQNVTKPLKKTEEKNIESSGTPCKNLEQLIDIEKEKDRDLSGASSSKNNKQDLDYAPVVKPTRRIEEYLKVVVQRGQMLKKHALNAPYYLFYTTITASSETHYSNNSITFQELLDPSLGELKCSLQLNFMVEAGWLMGQYYFAGYSKMSVLCYEDGSMRIIISTANLYSDDWENRTQALWFSPSCAELPKIAGPLDGESPTGFKKSLVDYLSWYRQPLLSFYIDRVKRCDFSHINVFLVTSVPGSHRDHSYGMTRVGQIHGKHCDISPEENSSWSLLVQSSSLGSFGKDSSQWLTGDFQNQFCKLSNQNLLRLTSKPNLKLIYPSLENVRSSHDNLLGGGCLPYSAAQHSKQIWLNTFLYQWKSSKLHRNRAMPHVKSYTRISSDNQRCAYLIITSANVSKAAWGSINKGNGALRIMSYEAGVMFLPKYVINSTFFSLADGDPNRVTLPYDIPPVKYTSDMSPWVQDYLMG